MNRRLTSSSIQGTRFAQPWQELMEKFIERKVKERKSNIQMSFNLKSLKCFA
ncbi:hypothetical protein B4U80_08493 [Leptotrombidium deliense]|uniref:Uncharacterized protein n=1 Tax=Leptotrombidium deliense TaxID=299467 RepID=A0A443STP6_9ACAR|nr:hypothetical protein B4U80_08493 [Leptotrombidium deliense]